MQRDAAWLVSLVQCAGLFMQIQIRYKYMKRYIDLQLMHRPLYKPLQPIYIKMKNAK